MKSLVIGMGIGQLYKTVLLAMGHEVVTVDMDPTKNADFQDYTVAYIEHQHFDTVHICTPNFTHLNIAKNVANHGATLVFVEKPGVESGELWASMIASHPGTRFMMVKNNQFRNEIKRFKNLADQSDTVRVTWNNRNRIPSPGSWFTTKELAYGGVARDLIPHMLSYYTCLTDYTQGEKTEAWARQNWQLSEIDSTDYGVVNHNGTYDVDDECKIEFINGKTKWILYANWRSLEEDNISISFGMPFSAVIEKLGLCPEQAYKEMIEQAIANLNNDKYWAEQNAQDIWIHQQIENL